MSLEFVFMVGLGRLRVGLSTAGLLVASLGLAAEGLAASFHLTTGDVVEGEILQATRNTLILRSGGSIRPTSLGQIDFVVLSLADGSELTGEFLDWKDGVFEIRSADVVMQVRDGVIVEDAVSEAAATPAPRPEPVEPTPVADAEAPSGAIDMQSLPELTMKDGRSLVGSIVHATGSVVTVRLHQGSIVPLSKAQIGTVRFVGEGGDVMEGLFVDWSDDVYRLESRNGDVQASLGPAGAAAGPPPALDRGSEVDAAAAGEPEAAIESADAAIAPDAAEISRQEQAAPFQDADGRSQITGDNEDPAHNEPAGAGGPVSETAVAVLQVPAPVADAAEPPLVEDGVHLVEPSVDEVGEDGEAIVFRFRLQPPATRPLVILYAATDDTAKAGEDFEAKSGVITFSAGSDYAEVRVPLIDDEQSETSEQFQLFLSGDPKTIQFSQRQIKATINDND